MLKKYENRRLYDSDLSRYVTIAEVRHRVLKGETVVKGDGTDATAEVLVGIIVEDTKDDKGPTAAAMRDFIQTYSGVASRRGARQVAQAG